MKKRLLSTLLTLCIMLALLPVTALAANSDFVIENGVLTKYNGPGGAVTIPSGVTSIGNAAFGGCVSLTSITIPNSVTTIGKNAFTNCKSLTSATISDSVTSIGNYTFQNCSSLTSVTLSNNINTISESMFEGCESLTSVTIPGSVTNIKFRAFYNCSSLTSVTIPNSVTAIAGEAFANCESLTSVTIPNSVTQISSAAFTGCTSLTSVTIPNSVIRISSVFWECPSLTDVYFSGNERQWEQIIQDPSDPLLNATIHYNSTGPSAPTTPSIPATGAVLSPQKLAVDGKNIDCEKYNIGGSNYFKLRDLAQLLSGTGSQFEVGYNQATSTVTITTGKTYTPAGGELAAGVDNSATAQPSNQTITINGTAHGELTVYNIGGSNFFQLRELGNVLGFEVDYDGTTNTAIVRSK